MLDQSEPFRLQYWISITKFILHFRKLFSIKIKYAANVVLNSNYAVMVYEFFFLDFWETYSKYSIIYRTEKYITSKLAYQPGLLIPQSENGTDAVTEEEKSYVEILEQQNQKKYAVIWHIYLPYGNGASFKLIFQSKKRGR